MSVQSDISRHQYDGNNSTVTPYPVLFAFAAGSDIRVIVTSNGGIDTSLVLGSGFTVTGAGNPNGGNVLTVSPVPTSSKVTIYREVPATQLTVYQENAEFPAKSHEAALDKLTMLVQQLSRKVLSSFRTRESDGQVTEIQAVPSSLMGFDAIKAPRAMTAAEVAVWLNAFTGQIFGQGSVTFLNTADRNATTPAFIGQVGVQVNTGAMYTGTALTAGAWGTPLAGIANGSIVTAMLADAVLSADTTGRAKMADAFITLAKLGAGIFTADTAGRAPFAAGFVNSALLANNLVLDNLPSGSVVQTVNAVFSSTASISTTFPVDNTIPQITEGTELLTATITPRSASNKILVLMNLCGATSNPGNAAQVAAFRDAVSNALAIATGQSSNGNGPVTSPHTIPLTTLDSPATTSAVTYRMRVGVTGNSFYVGANYAGSALFGGALRSSITLLEIKA